MQISPDASTVDLTRTRIKLRADVKFSPQVYDGVTFYHIEVPTNSQFYRIGYTEYVFLSLLDGATTFCEALALTARAQGGNAFPQDQALSLYSWLLENDIAAFADNHVPQRSASNKSKGINDILPKLNPFWIRLPFGNPEPLLKALKPLFGWIFSPVATVMGIFFMLAAVFQLLADWSKYEAASQNVFAPDNWLWLLVAWVLLKTVHETAHGLTCQRYGGQVRETGVILAFFAPLAYVDVTSCWAFPSKWQRIHTAAAGMYIELLLASAAVFVWPHVTSEVASHLLYNVMVMASISTILFNANPLMRFDGYYICSDLLQIPNLYTQSSQALHQLCKRVLFGVLGTTPTISGDRIWILRLYGISAFFWRLLICGSMMIAASVLFHGAGVMLSVLAVIAWFALPLWKTAQQCGSLVKTAPVRLVRVAGVAMIMCVLVISAFLTPVPFGTTAPGLVMLHEGCVIRSKASGFIDELHVTNGQSVSEGDLLVTLRNDELTSDFVDLQLQLRQETIRRKTAMKEHDPALVAIAEGNLVSLRERLGELARQIDSLQIHAEADGHVMTRQLELRRNTYVEEGDEIVTVDDCKPRELHVSVSQEDFAAAAKQINRPVHIRLGTRSPLTGKLVRVIPRASQRLADPALAATDGGSLAVTPTRDKNGDEIFELTEARFEAVVEFDAATNLLPIGERGYASLGRVEKSIGVHFYDTASKWFKQQLEAATQESML